MKGKFLISGIIILAMPFLTSASVIISEIMYDLDGSDGGREWVEIFNSGSEAVDLINWKLFEAETNHKLNLFKETDNFLLPSASYAVIADDPSKFLIDWPNFIGVVFDSSFSLSNTGETIIIRNAELIDISNIAYSSELGANGDGNSLQYVSGWIAANPTPGASNSSPSQSQSSQGGTQPESQFLSASGASQYVPPEKLPHIKAYAGEDKSVILGANVEFRGRAYGLNNEPLDNARFLWTFGDGSTKEGKNIVYAYRYPGEYVAVLNISSGEYSASDSLLIKAISNSLFISEIKTSENGWVELVNKSNEEIDISGMHIKNNNQIFIFPQNSRIRPGAYLAVPTADRGFIIYSGQGTVELLYAGGFKADIFNYNGFPSGSESFIRNGEESIIAEETPGAKNQELSLSKTSSTVQIPQFAQGSALQSTASSERSGNKNNKISENTEKSGEDVSQANIIKTDTISESKSNFKIYLLAVLGLIVVSSAAILLIRRKSDI